MNIIKTAKNYAKKIIGKENFEFVNHAKNYMTAEFFSKGLVFISIPIFTRLMSPEEYGVLSIFLSIISIATIIFSLNFHGAINRYYHEEIKNMGEFITSNLSFIFLFNIILFIIIYIYRIKFSKFINISVNVFTFAIIISILNIPVQMFLSYLQTSKQSKKYFQLTIYKNISTLLLSVLWIYLLNDSRYMGRVYGQFVIYLIFLLIVLYKFFKIGKKRIRIKYIKYSLNFGLPLIPHALSGILLSYFDRLAINQLVGPMNTGLYSFAYNVGMIMNVIVMAMNKAWVPIFYDKFKKNDYSSIDNIVKKYSKYIYISSIFLIFFSREIVMIIADKNYYDSLSIVPIIILSYVLVFFYTLFSNYSFYRKKTFLISIATLGAGLINIVLNYYFIPKYGYEAAAYTTLVSYSFLAIFHFINVKFVLKERMLIVKPLMLDFIYVIFIYSIYLYLIYNISNILFLFFIKICLFIISICYLFFKTIKSFYYSQKTP